MPTTLGFKSLIDLPMWKPLAAAPSSAGSGACFGCDLRNNEDRHPEIFYLNSGTTLYKYSVKNDEWWVLASPGLGGSFGNGAACVFVSEAGPSGTLAAGATTTSVILTTALPAAVAVNQLANRGDGVGFKIRIIGKSSGGSGKVEEKYIIGNTAGTTPTIYLDSALSFTPASTDGYEILSGKLYMLSAGTMSSTTFRSYDVATNSFASLAYANLPASIATDSELLSLSELYVPAAQTPGAGFLGNLVATASAATTITGTAAGADAAVLANEYRNFQIRIVQDTSTPTAVGQRRRIVSHTAGASPVYTVATWTVTPSANATFVIEGWGDCILLWTTTGTATYNYSISGNAWDSATTWAARGIACGAGVSAFRPFGIALDANKSIRYSYIYSIRGAATADIDLFDIAAAATGSWTSQLNYGNKGATTFTTGTHTIFDPVTNGARYAYISVNGSQRFARFDMISQMIEPWCYFPYTQSSSVSVGVKSAFTLYVDGTTKLGFLITILQGASATFACLLQR